MTRTEDAGQRPFSEAYNKSGDIVARSLAGEFLLIPIRGKVADMQAIFSLNPSGEFIWKCLDDRRTAREICSMLVEEYGIDIRTAEEDVREFLSELIEAGLIKEAA